MSRIYASDDELQNADFSNLDFSEMTEQERTEMKRRYREFVSAFSDRSAKAAAPEKKKHIKKWMPRQATAKR